MKKFILVASFAVSLFGIELKEGWNLVGLGEKTTHESLKSKNLELLVSYNYKNLKWQESGEIAPSDGVWIKTSTKTTLNAKPPLPGESRYDVMEFEKGWNLKALPINTTISPKIFDKAKIAWKYSNNEWKLYKKDDTTLEHPSLDAVGAGEGFWVYTDDAFSLNLTDEESKLTSFTNEKIMDEHLLAMVRYSKNYQGSGYDKYYVGAEQGDAVVTPVSSTTNTAGASTVSDTTSTNLQEKGVDEADILKHDGNKIFYLSQDYANPAILVTTFANLLENNSTKPLAQIKLTKKPNELYLVGNTLIALYPTNYSFWGLWSRLDFGVWSNKSQIEVYDVSDINAIKLKNSYEMDGNIIDSRLTGGKLYVATRFLPYIKVEYEKVYDVNCSASSYGDIKPALEPSIANSGIATSAATVSASSSSRDSVAIAPYYCWYPHDEKGYYRYDYNNPKELEQVLHPYIIENNTTKRKLLSPSNFYASYKLNQSPYITTITSFDVSDFGTKSHISVAGNSSTLYANNKAIYLVSQDYPLFFSWSDYRERSTIYKIGIDGGLSFRGKGFADGRILNQFSLSEHNDTLRIALTSGNSWQNNTTNKIVTMQDNNGELAKLGELSGLGKEGETIHGVRFLGDRGFVVTFKRTDPLYTIDLSDPKNPKKVGELSIPGYSSYFHPVDSDRILSIGRDADERGNTLGVQIQLFDISDFANPKLASKVVIGTSSTYSEAENNHKAFTYRDSDKLFAIPINDYKQSVGASEYKYSYQNYLSVYQVVDKNITNITKIDADTSTYSYDGQRSVFFTSGDKKYVLYLNGERFYLKTLP